MNHETRRAIALWRMSVLGPLVSMDLEHGDLRPLLEAAATRTYETPQGRRVRPCWRTLEAWYYAHKRGGLDALEPATRKDTGTCRALPEALAQHILALRREQPRRSVRTLVRAVERAGMCRVGGPQASWSPRDPGRRRRDTGTAAQPASLDLSEKIDPVVHEDLARLVTFVIAVCPRRNCVRPN